MNPKGKVTINDIAKEANTSKTTVSFYLNGKTEKMSEETKQRIAQIIEKYHYKPSVVARSLNSKKLKLIGVIIGDITNTFSNQLVKGIDHVARKEDYQIIVGNSNYSDKKEAQYVERMLAMGVDGFIVQPTSTFQKILTFLENQGKQIVFIDSKINEDQGSWVTTNNYQATYEATEACIQKGYNNFIMITADPTTLSTRMERAAGYQMALKHHNITCETYLVENDGEEVKITDFIVKQIKMDQKLLVFVANCWLLPKVFLALKQYQYLMPDKLGLLGFDNTEWTDFSSPTITSIVQPAYEEGKKAANILIDLIEERSSVPTSKIFDCTVNWGESTL